jgi:hypothetical protein
MSTMYLPGAGMMKIQTNQEIHMIKTSLVAASLALASLGAAVSTQTSP